MVDDDAVSRRVLTETLSTSGLPSHAVASGREALAWLEGHAPALVLLDLVMPEPDGFQVLKVIRDNPGIADTPVLVLSIRPSEAIRCSPARWQATVSPPSIPRRR